MESAFYMAVEKKSAKEHLNSSVGIPIPEDGLTFTPLQLIDICARLLKVPTDVLNLFPDTADLEEGFEFDLVQAEEDSRDDDQQRSEQPCSHDERIERLISASGSSIGGASELFTYITFPPSR